MVNCGLIVYIASVCPALSAEIIPTPGVVLSPLEHARQAESVKPAPEIKSEPISRAVIHSEKRIHINDITFNGHSLFSQTELRRVVQDKLSADLTLNEIYELADRVTRFYRNNGYILATATVPAQKISDGNIVFEIIEGRLGTISFHGNTGYRSSWLAAQMDSLHLGSVVSPVIQVSRLEHELLLLNDLPGIVAQAVIVPGAEFGQSDVRINIREQKFNYTLQLDNYGRTGLGVPRLSGGVRVNNVVSEGDRIKFDGLVSSGTDVSYADIGYDVVSNHEGGRLGFDISRFDYDVDTARIGFSNAVNATLSGSGNNYKLFYKQPWVRQASDTRSVELALVRKETDQSGTLALDNKNNVSINLASVSLDFERLNSASSHYFSMRLESNFNQGDKNIQGAKQVGKVTLDYKHLRPLYKRLSVMLHGLVVYSPQPLADTERVRLGGPYSVRAYQSSEASGDYGWYASADLFYAVPQYQIAMNSMASRLGFFVDWGSVYDHTRLLGERNHVALAGLGVGLDTSINSRYMLRVAIATPVTNANSSDNKETRLWASVAMSY